MVRMNILAEANKIINSMMKNPPLQEYCLAEAREGINITITDPHTAP